MAKTFHGKVHGQTIHIEEDLKIADGEDVEVIVRQTTAPRAWGEGIRRTAGAAANIPEFDDVFAQIEKERKTGRFPRRLREFGQFGIAWQTRFGKLKTTRLTPSQVCKEVYYASQNVRGD